MGGDLRCSVCGRSSTKFYRIPAIYNYPELREDLYLCPECQSSNRLITYLPMGAAFIFLLAWMLLSS